MADHSIIRGAKGISYYGIRTVSVPHTAAAVPAEIDPDPMKAKADFVKAKELNAWFWSYFPPVVRELSAMSPVLVARDTNWKPAVKIAGEFAARPFKGPTVCSWLDDHKIKTDPAGRFSDKLEPYSTRAFSNASKREVLSSQ